MDLGAGSGLKTGTEAPLVANIWCMWQYCRYLSLQIWPLQFVAQFWSSWAPASSPSGILHVCNRAPIWDRHCSKCCTCSASFSAFVFTKLQGIQLDVPLSRWSNCVHSIVHRGSSMGFFCLFLGVLPFSQHESTLQGMHNRKSNT